MMFGRPEPFHHRGTFVKSLNAIFIALTPKKKGAVEMKDFMPISLLGNVYKIIAKLLAERLKLVIYKLISANQNAFIRGRQIVDASLTANGSVERLVKLKKRVVRKLDLEKAYYHVKWSCLLNILKHMNFGDKWIDWNKYCLSTVRFSVFD